MQGLRNRFPSISTQRRSYGGLPSRSSRISFTLPFLPWNISNARVALDDSLLAFSSPAILAQSREERAYCNFFWEPDPARRDFAFALPDAPVPWRNWSPMDRVKHIFEWQTSIRIPYPIRDGACKCTVPLFCTYRKTGMCQSAKSKSKSILILHFAPAHKDRPESMNSYPYIFDFCII